MTSIGPGMLGGGWTDVRGRRGKDLQQQPLGMSAGMSVVTRKNVLVWILDKVWHDCAVKMADEGKGTKERRSDKERH